MTLEPTRARPPTHEAFWPKHLFTDGVGWVLVARFKSGGRRVEASIFLVDVFCLGAKLACYELCEAEDYRRRIRDHYLTSFPMAATEPSCARRLVEEAVQYARLLGFAPHADYKRAARVFGGVHAEECSCRFTFGHQGKPFYRRGPSETEERAVQIVRHLGRRCGEGNFDYLMMLGDADDITRAMEK